MTFDDFYTAEFPVQVRRAYLLVGSEEDAREIVQDAFVEVVRRWDSIEEPGPYVNRIVVNRCRDRYRRQQRAERVTRLLPRPDQPESHDDVLWDALHRLPFTQRAAIVMKYYGDLTTEEIAERLGSSPNPVGPWITRGLRKLRRSFDG